jgi:hypothetical protein
LPPLPLVTKEVPLMHLLLSLQPLRPLLFPLLARYLLGPPYLPRSLQPINIRLTMLWAGSTRLKAFSSTDGVEWMSWKTHCLKVCEINAWPNIRRVREARAAMAEKAARHTADIVPVYVADLSANPPVQITTWQDLIAMYQEKFMPPAAGVYSRAEYNIAKQISSEDVGGWHARLCNLYNRAYHGL